LLAAEARAQKAVKGLHGKDAPAHHVVDLSGDAAKAKQFLPYLQRAGKITALVEYVASGSRLRLFVPRETRLITFLLAGISCPRAGRAAVQGGLPVEGEPFGEEALAFTKDLCHQREVEIEVDSIDKAGNFIGFLWVDNKNLSVCLVEEGLSTVHFSAERTPYFRPLQIAEENAKARRDKIWQNFVDAKEEIKAEDDKVERKVDPKPVLVTEVTPELHVYVQFTDEGDKLETLMNDLRRELNEKPPLTGAYTPKKGDLCVARYSGDGEWYRARVEKILPDGEVAVVFFDYGNRENVKGSKCAQLPAISASSLPPFAKEYALACVSLPSDDDFVSEAIHAVRHDTAEGVFLLNVEYKVGGLDYVTLADKTSKEDVAQNLVKEGLLLVENKKERRLQKLLKDYKSAEEEAKRKHLCIWQYGDITEDDAREFGMGR
jgi:staphylococcal nuclease domain-containing protein 1